MRAKTLPCLSLVVLACAVGSPAGAADAAPATAAKTYTNADLAKFGPPEPTTTTSRRQTARADDAEAWAFVQAALDREAARLEAERRHALELEAARSYGADGCGSGGNGYLRAPWVGSHRRSHRRVKVDPFMGRRDTLHGRPSAEQRGHGRFEHLKGSDAFPGGQAYRTRSGSSHR